MANWPDFGRSRRERVKYHEQVCLETVLNKNRCLALNALIHEKPGIIHVVDWSVD